MALGGHTLYNWGDSLSLESLEADGQLAGEGEAAIDVTTIPALSEIAGALSSGVYSVRVQRGHMRRARWPHWARAFSTPGASGAGMSSCKLGAP